MKTITLENLEIFKELLMEHIGSPKNEWIQMVYPVGSIYIGTLEKTPEELFGFGTWEQIKDTFLLCAGDNYVGGDTGGEAEHTLTIEEIPSHAHTYKRHSFNNNDNDPDTGDDVYGVSNKMLDAHLGTTSYTGENRAHNNMPPYLTVYAWKRTA